ncbi:cytochrome C [Defluviimonas sp. 20V17]|uniref:Cytochrome c-type biogenesis protein CcmH n=1 Tax=Allgaiera indica TaxID=765699 RepID=A0AAN4UPR5_9RHOB|nr:c-type cytochrome biogenesis protein CcmI [Allgaiera indica]KDB03428.1 cytochrome C [Defluviimonas sp. 20V17]GHE00347.1 hypothetical protein GCM10008024_11490 [Allgaiera indica]SDW63299.1 cytochrome c-type biogenesis protein CcmH [Allgaiera indica]
MGLTGILDDWGFWLAAAFMVAAVSALMLLALVRGRHRSDPAAAYDLQVYRDQLREVDKDLARGTMSEAEAQRVRTEVSRRVLGADRALAAPGGPRPAPRVASWIAGGVIVASLAGAFALYLRVGDPGRPDDPMAARLAESRKLAVDRPSQAKIEALAAKSLIPPTPDPQYARLIDQLRAVVKQHPVDLKGQELLAQNEARLGHFIAAYHAQEAVIRIKGNAATAQDHAKLAELMVYAAARYVSPAAERQLNIALKMDPQNQTARFFMGVMMSQIGRPDIGFQIWETLLPQLPAGSPWIAPLRAQLPQMAELAGVRYELPPPKGVGPGPSVAQIDAAKDMTPAQRKDMIRGMVEGLAERLDTKGGTPQEWARLIRAYGVLGEAGKRDAALQRARADYKGNPPALQIIDAAAAVPGAGTTPAGATSSGAAPAALPGPSADDIRAAGQMSPAERQQMIEGMVSRLAEKLATQGGPAPEWARLIGAYGVLGRKDRARAIWDEAQTRFKDHPTELAQIHAAAARAGVAPDGASGVTQ